MNILYLSNHLNIGGISSYLLSLTKGLKQRGHNLYVAASGGELIPQFLEQGIQYIPIPIKTKSEVSPKIIISLFRLLKWIKKENIQLIHSHTRTTQVLGCLIKRFYHLAHVSTAHGFFKKRFSRRLFPCWGDKVIAISQEVKEHIAGDFGVREENIVVIHNGIDINRFREQRTEDREQIKKKFGLGDGPVIGIIARLSAEKGHNYLIQAMKEAIAKIPDAQLLIVGDGKRKKELSDLTKSLNLEKNVFFIPSVLDTEEVLSLMDIFVLPSTKEGLGLSLMEAMAAGLAVIGSRVGGIKALIKDGYNGLMVEPGDSHQLAAAILKLLADPRQRKYLGENARNFVKENFSQDKMSEETEKVYLECLSKED
ncbi:MAG: glycosyltransferase family 4 protein [Candidatus Omnitrophica bacterium]|nr:glycosyltransferase family 4 protein [Candidatus Omnitrophota bacterium]